VASINPKAEKAQMRFYTETHKHYCGIDLHTKNLYVCLIDHEGEILVHKNIKARPEALDEIDQALSR
jgi:predicted NBD/HSP70 family sugar kinase